MLGAENWCIKVDEKVYGPYTTEQMRKYAHEGRLAPWSQISPAGAREWREARREGVFAAFFGEHKQTSVRTERAFGKRDAEECAGSAANGKIVNARGRPAPALANFIVVFDDADGAANRLETAIHGLGRALKIADNVWSVTCDLTAVGVRNALAPYLTPREPIYVVDATRGRSSWQNYAPELHAKITATHSAAGVTAHAS